MTNESEKLLTPRERDFLARYPEAQTEPQQDAAKLHGVGGWLGLLVALLLVIYPIFVPLKTWLEIAEATDMHLELVQHAAWPSLVTLSWIIVGISVAISFFAGWRLNFRHVRTSVTVAIISLWLIGPVGVLIELVLMSSITGTSIGSSADFADIIRSLIVSAIWTAYLVRSRRVRNTYGS